LNWQNLVPNIDRALQALVQQTPMPVDNVTTLLHGIYPALIRSDVASFFTPTTIVSLLKAIKANTNPNESTSNSAENVAAALRFLGLVCQSRTFQASNLTYQFLIRLHQPPTLVP